VLDVTPEQVRTIAHDRLRPDQMTIVVVGDKKTITEQTAPYGTTVP
jgi:predicted Zn-dependent peptidase